MAQNTTQNVYTQTRLPAWIKPYYESMAGAAQQEAMRGYTPYGGQRLAGFNPAEAQALQGIGSLGLGGPSQGWQEAMGRMSPALSQMGGITGQYQPLGQAGQQAGTGAAQNMMGIAGQYQQTGQQNLPMSTNTDWSQYMQPYNEYVTNPVIREIEQAGRRQLSGIGGQAATQGAFGGARHGLLERGVMQDTRQQVEDARNKAASQAYQQGINLFQGDRSAQQQQIQNQMQGLGGALGAQQGAFNAQMGGLGFGADMLGQQGGALQNYLGGIGQLGTMSAQGEQNAFDRLRQAQSAGEAVRAQQQAGLDIGYNDFLRQQNYPRESLSWFGSILGGFPHQNMGSSNTSTAQNSPGLFQTMLGTGIGGLGMYNAYGGGYPVSQGPRG